MLQMKQASQQLTRASKQINKDNNNKQGMLSFNALRLSIQTNVDVVSYDDN